MNFYLRSLLFVLALTICSNVLAGPFEGVIFFQKADGQDVTYFRYYIKGNHIRIEDVNEGGGLNGML